MLWCKMLVVRRKTTTSKVPFSKHATKVLFLRLSRKDLNMNVKVHMQPCNNKRKYFNCDGDIPVQRRFTTLGSHLQFQWQPHNVISWNLHNPSPCPLLLDLLISLICCSKPHAPLPFYKNLHFYEANKWHCLHKDITRRLINMWVDTFQKQLSIGGVCVRRYGPARCLLSEYGEIV